MIPTSEDGKSSRMASVGHPDRSGFPASLPELLLDGLVGRRIVLALGPDDSRRRLLGGRDRRLPPVSRIADGDRPCPLGLAAGHGRRHAEQADNPGDLESPAWSRDREHRGCSPFALNQAACEYRCQMVSPGNALILKAGP